MKRSYGSFLVEALLWGGSFMVAIFLLLLGAWKLLGVASASLMIFGFQLGFSGSIYMIAMPLVRCAVKSLNIEIYHFGYLVIGAIAAYFTYHQLVRMEEFRFEITGLLLIGLPFSLLLALRKKKEEASPVLETPQQPPEVVLLLTGEKAG